PADAWLARDVKHTHAVVFVVDDEGAANLRIHRGRHGVPAGGEVCMSELALARRTTRTMRTSTASSTRLAMIVACLSVIAFSGAVDCTAPHVLPHSSVPLGQACILGSWLRRHACCQETAACRG